MNEGILIYDLPIARTNLPSAVLNYTLACAKAALLPCMKPQNPSSTMHSPGSRCSPSWVLLSTTRTNLVSNLPGTQGVEITPICSTLPKFLLEHPLQSFPFTDVVASDCKTNINLLFHLTVSFCYLKSCSSPQIHAVPSCSTRLHRYGSGCPDAGRDKNARWQFWFCTIPKHCFLLCNLSPSAEMAITAATARVKFSTESLIRMTGYSGI